KGAAGSLLDVKHVEEPVVGSQDERRSRGPVERQAKLRNQRAHHGQLRCRKQEVPMRARTIGIVPFRKNTSAHAEIEARRAWLRPPFRCCPESGPYLLWQCRPRSRPKKAD